MAQFKDTGPSETNGNRGGTVEMPISYTETSETTGTFSKTTIDLPTETRQDTYSSNWVFKFGSPPVLWETAEQTYWHYRTLVNPPVSTSQFVDRLRKEFSRLAEQWEQETLFESSIDRIISHNAYRRIIAMGSSAVPFILEDLQQAPTFWFWALTSITGESPEPPDSAGDIELMTKAWLDWGRRSRIIA